jgi:hypothetical protein
LNGELPRDGKKAKKILHSENFLNPPMRIAQNKTKNKVKNKMENVYFRKARTHKRKKHRKRTNQKINPHNTNNDYSFCC